jgi:hypothetical protein
MDAPFPLNPDPRNVSPRYPIAQASRHSATFEQRFEHISQSTIQELRELKEQLRIIRTRHDKVKAEVIGKLQNGVPIQQGALMVRLVTRSYRYLSAKSLYPLLGKVEVERLKQRVQPRDYSSVEISEID